MAAILLAAEKSATLAVEGNVVGKLEEDEDAEDPVVTGGLEEEEDVETLSWTTSMGPSQKSSSSSSAPKRVAVVVEVEARPS